VELLLKRNETGPTLWRRFDLFAKLELAPEEATLIKKANGGKTLVLKGDPRSAQVRWRLCLIPGAIGAIILGMIVSAMIHMFHGAVVMIIAWIPLTKLLFNQVRPMVTIADLISGRTIHCSNLEELLVKEDDIRENTKSYIKNLQGFHSLGNEQRIDLSRG
jgi:hypothetical protein